MDKKNIIWGCGDWGKKFIKLIIDMGYENKISGLCDSRADEINFVYSLKVMVPECYLNNDFHFIISIQVEEYINEICTFLKDSEKFTIIRNERDIIEKIPRLFKVDRSTFIREYAAAYHIDNMNDYFARAESNELLEKFWGKNTVFYKLFSQLDTRRIIELACGRGRHVPFYMDDAIDILLVDILKKNTDYCRDRFQGNSKIRTYTNNGFNLEEIESEKYTALFSYDAMVHFELMDIYQYLLDIYRVLELGGMALFHHSNNHSDYKLAFPYAQCGRNYMSKDIFAYLSYRAGFDVISQEIIDWRNYKGDIYPNLDCVTLVRK